MRNYMTPDMIRSYASHIRMICVDSEHTMLRMRRITSEDLSATVGKNEKHIDFIKKYENTKLILENFCESMEDYAKWLDALASATEEIEMTVRTEPVRFDPNDEGL